MSSFVDKKLICYFLDLAASNMTSLNLPRRFDELIEMPREIEDIVYGEDGERYISEVISLISYL